mgnify:CR=1 FL=1
MIKLFNYNITPAVGRDQRDIGLTGIDLDLLTGGLVIVMSDSVLGRLGPGNLNRLTLSDIISVTSGIDCIVDQITFTQFCKGSILNDNILEGQLYIGISILVRRTVLIIIISFGIFVVL